jgi:lysozyme
MQRISTGGAARCIKLEGGFKLVAYLDSAGIATIGAGHTRNVRLGMTATLDQCQAWFKDDIRGAEMAVSTNVKVPLSQNQFDALCIWQFNTGGLVIEKKGKLVPSAVLTALTAGEYDRCIDLMQQWKYTTVTVAGKKVKKVSSGLINRRAQEALIWSTPDSDQTKHAYFGAGVGEGTPAPPAVLTTNETPEAPPTAVISTTTGKAQVGAIGAGITALVQVLSDSVSSIRQVASPIKEALGLPDGYSGYLHYGVIVALLVSIGFGAYTLWRKKGVLAGTKE